MTGFCGDGWYLGEAEDQHPEYGLRLSVSRSYFWEVYWLMSEVRFGLDFVGATFAC